MRDLAIPEQQTHRTLTLEELLDQFTTGLAGLSGVQESFPSEARVLGASPGRSACRPRRNLGRSTESTFPAPLRRPAKASFLLIFSLRFFAGLAWTPPAKV